MTVGASDLVVAFSAGALTFLSPCVLPVVPGYLGVIGAGDRDTRPVAPIAAFVGAFSLVFVLLGAGAGLAGSSLLAHRSLAEKAGGVLLVAAGVAMLGRSLPGLASREIRFHIPPRLRVAGRIPFAAATGGAFALGWSPCIGPTLGAILTLAASRESAASGVVLLSVFSLGLAVPFTVAGFYGVGLLRHPRVRRSARLVRSVSGVLMLAGGLLLASGQLSAISGKLAGLSLTP